MLLSVFVFLPSSSETIGSELTECATFVQLARSDPGSVTVIDLADIRNSI
jgi:hypothetical protein